MSFHSDKPPNGGLNRNRRHGHLCSSLAIVLLLAACGTPALGPTPSPPIAASSHTDRSSATLVPTLDNVPDPSPTATPTQTRHALSDEEIGTLNSLEQVDGYPLYTMRYRAPYERGGSAAAVVDGPTASPSAWACSLFAALGDKTNMLYGRNFDWQFSPALLLFTDPPDGYASVTLVDIAYLVPPENVHDLAAAPLPQRQVLLDAPYLPFDGMNEHGLAIGMAAVPGTEMPYDAARQTVDSVRVMREVLDRARDVDEALAIFQSYNITMHGGPPIHYLIADRSGRALLLEFYQGELVVIPNKDPWHLATNFLRAEADETGHWQCARYDRMLEFITAADGRISTQDAVGLLEEVSQSGTQWSVVYGLSSGEVRVTMARKYDTVHTFHLDPAGK